MSRFCVGETTLLRCCYKLDVSFRIAIHYISQALGYKSISILKLLVKRSLLPTIQDGRKRNSVTFSVTIALKTGKNELTVAKNSFRKTLNTNTWYDLFEAATENVPESPDFPGSIWNDFEKNSSLAVSSAQAGEPYYPDPYDEIKTLTDLTKPFDM